MAADNPVDARLEQAIALLSGLLGDEGSSPTLLSPWTEPPVRIPMLSGRISATDRLSWWFRPSLEGRDAWDSFFEQAPTPFADEPGPSPVGPASVSEPPGRRAALRLLLAEPDEEMMDADAEAVVTCLYDFVHAVGRGDVATAAEECVAPDYHAMEEDVEIDRDGLAAQLRAQLDRLRGWEIDVSLVEIPEPILHPEGILVYTEFQIEARRGEERQTILHRRLAVFRQNRDRRWRIVALSQV